MKPGRPWGAAALLALGLGIPTAAAAHAFAQPYALPVPFGYYAFGASFALIASFAVTGLFATTPRIGRHVASPEAASASADAGAIGVRGGIGALLLLACVVSGLVGSRNPYTNFNMTFFWIVFVLAVPYAVAVGGDFYARYNPWLAVVTALEAATGTRFRGHIREASRLRYAPAILLYMAFIWLELFAQLSPRGLSIALLAYTAINVAGAWLLGKRNWFEHGELFAVIMRLLGSMSLRPYRTGAGGKRWEYPCVGLLSSRPEDMSLVVFILFMLSSTAFDGLHSSQVWTRFFFGHVYPAIEPLLSGTERDKFAASARLFEWWQWVTMLMSPFVYLAALTFFVAIAKAVTRSTASVASLTRQFAMSLVPIAFVYHVTHYYTLLLSQGPQMLRLASDPFGLNWNLFGTAALVVPPIMVGAAFLWGSQVALIVAGHVAGVFVAHVEALKAFGTRKQALLSQLPMLVLMMLFTALGLWILSLPLAPGS